MVDCQSDKKVEAVFAVWLPFRCFWMKIYRCFRLRCISRFVAPNPSKIAPLASSWFVDIETKTIGMISIIFRGDIRWSNNSPWFWIENDRIILTTKRNGQWYVNNNAVTNVDVRQWFSFENAMSNSARSSHLLGMTWHLRNGRRLAEAWLFHEWNQLKSAGTRWCELVIKKA